MRKLVYIFSPLMIYLLISGFIGMLAQQFFPALYAQSTAMVTVISAVTIPVMIRLRQRDRRMNRRRRSQKDKRRYTNRRKAAVTRSRDMGMLLILMAAGAACSYGFSVLMNLSGIAGFFSNEVQEALFAAPLWLQVLGAGILGPAAEELTYRCAFYERAKRYLNAGPALFLTALLFAIGHGNMLQGLYAFPMGLILGIIYEKTGRPSCPIAFHAGANLISIVITFIG